jgi:NAD(P)-dependent dehydrogenase (short-subunit alcohol dehydrogenase family)
MILTGLNIHQGGSAGQVVVITSAGRQLDEKAARVLAHLSACVAAAVDEGVAAAEPKAAVDEASVETGEVYADGGTVDLPSDRAVFCTSTRLLRKSVQDLPRMLMGDRRKDFLAMREFLREVLRLDGGVTISTETFNERVQTVS